MRQSKLIKIAFGTMLTASVAWASNPWRVAPIPQEPASEPAPLTAEQMVDGEMSPQAKLLAAGQVPVLRAQNESFTFEDINYWAGDGLNRAALVVQWNDERETHAMVFGYRFNGNTTAYDMLQGIIKEHPCLVAMVSQTYMGGISYILGGLGYDKDWCFNFMVEKDGSQTQVKYWQMTQMVYNNYDYDGYESVDPDHYWGSGWMENYWSLWHGTPGDFTYSSVGQSSLTVSDGSWIAWNFLPYTANSSGTNDEASWKPFQSAENYQQYHIDSFEDNGLKYTVTNHSKAPYAEVSGWTTDATGAISIPTSVAVSGNGTYKITRVADNAFKGIGASAISLNSNIYYIGNGAFEDCTNLTSVSLPSKIYGMGEGLFKGCSGFTVPVYPAGFDFVPAHQFDGTGISDIALPATIKSVGEAAYANCHNIKELTFDKTCQPVLGAKAFAGCDALETVTVKLNEPFEIAEDAFAGTTAKLIVPIGAKETFANAPGWRNFTQIEDTYTDLAIGGYIEYGGVKYRVNEGYTATVVPYNPDYKTATDLNNGSKNYTGDLVIPSRFSYQGVELAVDTIEQYAFYGAPKACTSVTIGDGIVLKPSVFANAAIGKVVLPADLKVIPAYSFYRNSSSQVEIPASVEEIGSSAFATTGGTLVPVRGTVPATVKKIGNAAFRYSAIEEFVQPEALTHLPDSLFMNASNLKTAKLHKGTTFGGYVFAGTGLTDIQLPEDMTVVAGNMFYNCKSLTAIELPKTVTTLASGAFYGSGLKSISLPETITTVADYQFTGCTSLTKVEIPYLTHIGRSMFSMCSALTEVVVGSNLESIDKNAFERCAKLEKITVFGDESGESRIPDAVTELPYWCFYGCSSLKVKMPASLKTIGDRTFYQCSALDWSDAPNLETIGSDAFYQSGLTWFLLPESIQEIKSDAFLYSNNLQAIYVLGNPATKASDCINNGYGTSAPKFPLIVPVGETGNSKYTSGWASGTSITAPTFAGASFGNTAVNISDDNSVTLVNDFNVTYDMDIKSETFAKYNNNKVMQSLNAEFGMTLSRIVGDKRTEQHVTSTVFDGLQVKSYTAPLTPADYEYCWKFTADNLPAVTSQGSFVIEQQYVSGIDISKVLNHLGEGENEAMLRVTWNDDVALDNLVSGVRFDGTATLGDILHTALKYDSRFYSMVHTDGEFAAFGFDTNGDNSAAVSVGGTALTLTEGITTATTGYSTATAASVYDHWKVNDADSCWTAFVNGKPAVASTDVSAGDEVTLQYLPVGTTEMPQPAYSFYLRPDTEQGIWMLEECVLNTENGKQAYFPMIANVLDDGANLYGAGISTEVYEPDGVTTSNAYSAYVTNGTKGAMMCRVNVSKPTEALIRPFLNIRKDWGAGKAEVKRIYGGTDSKVSTVVAHPMTNITLEGVEEGGVIEIDNMSVAIIKPVYEPADADFTGYVPVFGNSDIATFYSSVNAIVAHSAGDTELTITDLQGNEYGKYTVRVKDVDPDNKPDDDFQDGLVFLNEEWFTHTSGSLNYIDAEGNIFYRAYGNQNGNMAFGATSQFGTTYAGKYIIMSKQAWDGGDTRPLKSGGRVVVFDAKTFKHIGAVDEIGGDGRACVGVNPSKVYLGTTNGVRVMNLDDVTIADADIEGISVKRNTGMIGDMVKAGKYVFIANIGTGLEIVDAQTDKLILSVADTKIQTVALTKDGRVWFASNGSGTNTLTPVNPMTLEVGNPVSVPGAITCSSSTWRHGNLMASTKENVLLWGKGSYNGNDGDLYRWNIDEVADPSTLAPLFVRDSDFNKAYGYGYGSPAYDDRTDTYIFATTLGFGAAALNNWYHFVNATTGEVRKSIKLASYWWFPAMPIVPDKYDAEINLDNIELEYLGTPKVIDLSEVICDSDNHDCNINVYIDEYEPVSLADNDGSDEVAKISLEDKILTVTPVNSGTRYFTLNAESNGRVTSKEIQITVDKRTSVSDLHMGQDKEYTLYTTSGIKVATFFGSPDKAAEYTGVAPGVYILSCNNGDVQKIVIR